MHAHSGADPENSVIGCSGCGKLHRIASKPMQAGGQPAREFLLTCIQCGRTQIREASEIRPYAAQKQRS